MPRVAMQKMFTETGEELLSFGSMKALRPAYPVWQIAKAAQALGFLGTGRGNRLFYSHSEMELIFEYADLTHASEIKKNELKEKAAALGGHPRQPRGRKKSA